jgi:AGCS family alanine or glycine:cation symporter
MKELETILISLKDAVWSAPLLLLLLGTGIYLTIILNGVQFRYLGFALKEVFAKKHAGAKGDITHFESLMTSLAGAIGTGTIVGVATGVMVGGMGAIFWMWVTALLSMATKYAESLLAVKYRVLDKRGEMIGGPMEYMERGLQWKKTAKLFAVFGVIAAFGTGNLVQVNSIAQASQKVWGIDPWLTGLILAVLVGAVILGGVKSIGHVAGVLVPVMAIFYFLGGMAVIFLHFDKVPITFFEIFKSAFTGQAAFGGFAGSTLMLALQMGVARSVFSNESGLGISSIAAAAAITDNPGRQAMITMTGALLSTVIVCTITGLAIGVTGVQGMENSAGDALNGASLVIEAFEGSLRGGAYIVSIGLILFAFSTVIAWGYYGEKCAEYLFGERSIYIFRALFTLFAIPGAAVKLEMAWSFADISNGLMAIPNLIAIVALSKPLLEETASFLKIADKEIAEG